MNELLDDGTTVLFVSHSSAQVKEMCNNAIWIEKGKTKMVGRADTVINAYEMA